MIISEKQEQKEEEKKKEQEEAFQREIKEYRALKTEKWGSQGIPDDPAAPVFNHRQTIGIHTLKKMAQEVEAISWSATTHILLDLPLGQRNGERECEGASRTYGQQGYIGRTRRLL